MYMRSYGGDRLERRKGHMQQGPKNVIRDLCESPEKEEEAVSVNTLSSKMMHDPGRRSN